MSTHKKMTLSIVLFTVLFTTALGSAEQATNNKPQDPIEELYNSGRISKEQYIKMKQNTAELEQRDKNRQDKDDGIASQSEINFWKSQYLSAYKDNIITKSQFVRMCRFHDEYSTDRAMLKSSELLEAEGNFDAFNEWAKIKGPEMQAKQQTAPEPDYASIANPSSAVKKLTCNAIKHLRLLTPKSLHYISHDPGFIGQWQPKPIK